MANGITNLKDDELKDLLNLMAQNAPTVAGQLGLSPEQIAQIQDAASGFQQAQQEASTALEAYQSAVALKDGARLAALKTVRPMVVAWKVDPSVGPGVLEQMGVAPDRKRRHAVPVFTPSKLVATADRTGNTLTWQPNGNEYRTTYVVEKRGGADQPWAFFGVTTSTRLVDHEARPGEPVWYRVRSERSGRASVPTLPTGCYLVESERPSAA